MLNSGAFLHASDINTTSSRTLKAIVRYTYEAEDGNQLSLRQVGDVIIIHSQDSEDWWDGEFNGERGYLPAKYVELLERTSYSIPSYDSPDVTEMEPIAHSHDKHRSLVRGSADMYLSSSSAVAGTSATTFADPLLAGPDVDVTQAYWTNATVSSIDDVLGPGAFSDSDVAAGGGLATAGIFTGARGRNIFSLWSSSLGRLSGCVAVVTGALTMLMGLYDGDDFGDRYTFIGVYAVILGGLTLLYEMFWGRRRRGSLRLPIRTVIYGAASVPLLFAYPTRVAGILYGVVAVINLVAALRGEVVSIRPRRLDHPEEGDGGAGTFQLLTSSMSGGSLPPDRAKDSIFPASFATFFLDRSLPNRGRRWALLLALVAWNVIACILVTYWRAHNGVGTWNAWYSAGRVLEWLVLLNLLLFFTTAMRSTSRILYDAAERSRVAATRTLANSFAATWLTFLPVDPHHALLFFHNLLAGLVIFYSALHGLAHTLSYMLQPNEMRASYNDWVWVSGGLLIVLMLLIYSVSRREVRIGSPLLFRWMHALYVPFFVLLVLHAPKGFSVVSALVLCLPMAIAIADHVLNYFKQRRLPVPMLSVSFIRPNAIRIELNARSAPAFSGPFSEGSFAYINFPALTRQWLPVTLSSAPQAGPMSLQSTGGGLGFDGMQNGDFAPLASDEPTGVEGGALTFHLHIDSSSLTSPTARWSEYFQQLGPLGSNHFVLDEPNASHHHAAGRITDNEGRNLIRIDGPHSSPVQHLTQYRTALVAAPSSGTNALASAMRSVLQHRWKANLAVAGGFGDSRLSIGGSGAKKIGTTTPDVLFMYWTIQWSEIDDYRWMIQTIKDCEDELFVLRDGAADGPSDAYFRTKHFELHVFVVGPPSDAAAAAAAGRHVHAHGLSEAMHEEGFFGPSGFSGASSSSPVRAPFTALQLYLAMKDPTTACQRFSNVHVHRGPPNWGEQLQAASHRAPGQSDIGVIYTAGPLAAHLTHCGAAALRDAGLVDVPSYAAIEANHETSRRINDNCKHYAAQSGKKWIYHTDVDVDVQ